MYVQQIREAVAHAPRCELARLAEALWKGFAVGAIGETDAQALAEEIEAKKAVPVAPSQPRRVGSRPRSSASIERRRRHSASGMLPPQLACQFTISELAALTIVAEQVMQQGYCGLAVAAIAGRAGTCATVVKNAIRQASRLGLINVEARRVRHDRNLPNVLTVVSAEWSTWIATRAKGFRRGGVRSATTTQYTYISKSESNAGAAWKAGPLGEAGRKIGASRTGDIARRLFTKTPESDRAEACC